MENTAHLLKPAEVSELKAEPVIDHRSPITDPSFNQLMAAALSGCSETQTCSRHAEQQATRGSPAHAVSVGGGGGGLSNSRITGSSRAGLRGRPVRHHVGSPVRQAQCESASFTPPV